MHNKINGCLLFLVAATLLQAPVVAQATEIWFVRHAESEFNTVRGPLPVPDEGVSYPLTALGVEQAVALASQFEQVRVDYLYSSTRLRTLQTADAISFATGVPVMLAPEAVEVSFGPAPDLYQDAYAVFRRWAEGESSARTEGGESLEDVRARFMPLWQRLVAAHGEQADTRVVLVTHGGIIMFLIPELCAELTVAQTLQRPVANTGILKTELEEGSLRCVDYQGLSLE